MRKADSAALLARCRRWIVGSVLFALAMTATAVAEETARIGPATLLKRLDANDSALIVLDVRTPEEFAAGHVPHAVNIPYTYLPASISTLPDAANKDIVVYCETGVRAERAAARFRENGFTRLLHLDGDMRRWREAGRPLEGTTAP